MASFEGTLLRDSYLQDNQVKENNFIERDPALHFVPLVQVAFPFDESSVLLLLVLVRERK